MDDARLLLHGETVRPEWVDYNGHMNLAYYVLAFDHATDALFDHLDIGEAYMRRSNCSIFALETHVTYDREVRAGDPLRFASQLIDFDDKRFHYFHAMFHAEDAYLAATTETVSIHVDLATRRAAPFGAPARDRLDALRRAQADLARPPQVGRALSIGAGRARGGPG